MSKLYAVRNISLCTKDCLCLYVCPTGASDTEDSIIDKTKCIGCSACVNACPSNAISLVPVEYPVQQVHQEEVIKAMKVLFESKSIQEELAATMPNKLAKAFEKSNRIMAEDIIREAGFMLPQSGNAAKLLEEIKSSTQDAAIQTMCEDLLSKIKFNEEMKPKESYKCTICGYIHEGILDETFECPICRQPSSVFEKLD